MKIDPKQIARMITEDPDEINPLDDEYADLEDADEFEDDENAVWDRDDEASIFIRTTDRRTVNHEGWDEASQWGQVREIGLWRKAQGGDFSPQDFNDIIKFIEAKGYQRQSFEVEGGGDWGER
jgi:hypothetical protein